MFKKVKVSDHKRKSHTRNGDLILHETEGQTAYHIAELWPLSCSFTYQAESELTQGLSNTWQGCATFYSTVHQVKSKVKAEEAAQSGKSLLCKSERSPELRF